MIGITGVCSKLVGEVVQVIGSVSRSRTPSLDLDQTPVCNPPREADDFMIRALTAVFGMENSGRIKKEKARQVVEKLGLTLMYGQEEAAEEEEVGVEEVLSGLEQVSERQQLLHEAFKIFDEDGNGYIEAAELKRVLQCLGLDKGWDLSDIEKMLKVVDLNLDGKVDFTEFELMMS